MDAIDPTDILAKHKAWLAGAEGGQRADLSDADLTDADLTRANLTRANLTRANLTDANLTDADLADAYLADAYLTRANLTRANLTDANLTRANLTDADLTGAYLADAYLADAYLARAVGIRWGQIGPVGQGRRLLTAWAHDSLPEPIITGGCFRGTFAEFREAIAGCPWGWAQGTDEDRERWRAECSAAADFLGDVLGGDDDGTR